MHSVEFEGFAVEDLDEGGELVDETFEVDMRGVQSLLLLDVVPPPVLVVAAVAAAAVVAVVVASDCTDSR